MKETHFK